KHYKEKQQLLASAPAVVAAPEQRLKADSAQVGRVQGRSTRDGVNLERLEQDISEIEQQLRSIDETMMDPANAASPAKLATLYEERELLQAKLDSLYEKWMESSTSS
ncbi:hypothetical protein GNF83_19340, partial [Clostridium perfringens]|nr:hypothetical protein [Clostridium perfringens]